MYRAVRRAAEATRVVYMLVRGAHLAQRMSDKERGGELKIEL